MANSEVDSTFMSGKKRVEERTAKKGPVSEYAFGVMRGILQNKVEDEEEEELRLQEAMAEQAKQWAPVQEKKAKKRVQFNQEAQQINYEREDYFQPEQSIFRDMGELNDEISRLQTHKYYEKKRVVIPETEQEEKKMEHEQEILKQEWGGNILVLSKPQTVEVRQQQEQEEM